MTTIRKVSQIEGNRLRLRNVAMDDAEFIIALRNDFLRRRFISATSSKIKDQRNWLLLYAADPTQAYFIICSRDDGVPIGTVRLYDAVGESFCWGSWVLMPAAPATTAIESALIVYEYARLLGFRKSHFTVQKQNVSVRRFHEKFGAVIVNDDGEQLQYTLSQHALEESMVRYRRFLPNGINVGNFV